VPLEKPFRRSLLDLDALGFRQFISAQVTIIFSRGTPFKNLERQFFKALCTVFVSFEHNPNLDCFEYVKLIRFKASVSPKVISSFAFALNSFSKFLSQLTL